MNNPGSTPASLAAARSSTPYENPNHAIIELELLDPATGTAEVIETTDNHPFYVAERGWTRVDQLRLGDQIPTSHGNLLTVQRIYLSGRIESVYNFGVDGFHTYFVGVVGAWVHNCYQPKGLLKGKRVGHTFSKHGSHNTEQLIREAAGSGRSQSQWLNDAAAEELIGGNLSRLHNGAITIDIPDGVGRVIMPDGTFVPATRAILVPSKNGIKTAYPIIK